MQMKYLLQGLDKKIFSPVLGTLYEDAQLKKDFSSIKQVPIVNFHKRGPLDIFVYCRIARYAKKNNIDIICTFMGNHHAYIPAILAKTKAIGGIRNMGMSKLKGLRKIKEICLQRRMLNKKSYSLIANSFEAKKLCVQEGFNENKIAVIPNGIPYENLSSGKKTSVIKEFDLQRKYVITMIGRLIPSKNHLALIEAFLKILKQKKDAVLLIVGDGPMMSELTSAVKKRNLTEKIVFTGNRKDVANILAASNLFVFPSLSEGWPNALGEAMAAGVPIVTYSVGDTNHIVKDGESASVTKMNMDDFAARTIELLKNKNLQTSYAAKSKQIIKKKFSTKVMVKSFEEAFNEALEVNS